MQEDDVLTLIDCFVQTSFRLHFISRRIVRSCEGYPQLKQHISKEEFIAGFFYEVHIWDPVDAINKNFQEHTPKVLTILQQHPNSQLSEYHENVSEFMTYCASVKEKFLSVTFEDDDINTMKVHAEKLIEPSQIMMQFDYQKL